MRSVTGAIAGVCLLLGACAAPLLTPLLGGGGSSGSGAASAGTASGGMTTTQTLLTVAETAKAVNITVNVAAAADNDPATTPGANRRSDATPAPAEGARFAGRIFGDPPGSAPEDGVLLSGDEIRALVVGRTETWAHAAAYHGADGTFQSLRGGIRVHGRWFIENDRMCWVAEAWSGRACARRWRRGDSVVAWSDELGGFWAFSWRDGNRIAE